MRAVRDGTLAGRAQPDYGIAGYRDAETVTLSPVAEIGELLDLGRDIRDGSLKIDMRASALQ